MDMQGLNWANMARNRGESVRPDLWPDHAWVPALGCQGGVLYDLCHVPSTSNGTIESCTWGQNKLLFDGSTSYVSLPLDLDMETYPVCVFSVFESTVIATRQYLYSMSYGGGSRRHHSIGIEASTGVALNGAYAAGISFIYSANSITAGLNCIYAEWVASTYRSIRLNSGAVVTATSEQVMEPSLLNICRIGQNYNIYDTALMFAGAVHEVLLYKRQLTDNQYNDLRGDYLLPFRRRTIQKYWVPAGGETTTYFLPQFMNHKFIPSFNGGR